MISSAGILGMNQRNAYYILPQNPRKYYPLVDNKLLTKKLLEEHSIPTPILYHTIEHIFEFRFFNPKKIHEFVIKPARGAEGRGILPIVGKVDKKWKTIKGALLSKEDMEYHVTNILAGLYSLGGSDDQAFIEYFVRPHQIFKPISYAGVPDIRMILYRGVPVMSMLRLPTKESGGRANLHQGAMGTGLILNKGITLGGVHHNKLVEMHPDTGKPIAGVQLPFWEEILAISARTYEIFKLGYMGIDFVIDILLGPLILELNARPGLSIQLANRDGLLRRLRLVDAQKIKTEQLPPEKRVELAKHLFSE